ncbi:MAG: translesion error-prone DNA polymerase V autoproteolytic subunit [Chitinophagaceae bacterium]
MKIVNILAIGGEEGGAVYYPAAVKAGFPSPAADYVEERIDLNEEFIKHPLSTFLVNCEGDSMKDAFIPPKAMLIVDRSINAKNGDIVLAVLNGEFTVKYLKKKDGKCWLVPANNNYKSITITDEMQFQVWGVVTTIFTAVKELPLCMH